MSAIGVHHTATTDSAWDGGANTKNLKADQDEAYYRRMFAWQDPEGDPKTKAAYKFPHHMVSGEGAIGAANVKACVSIIGILNGGMGGADIPSGDRQGVYRHAAAHLKDAGEEPPELKTEGTNPRLERRSVDIDLRAEMLNDRPVIKGVAAIYNQETVITGFWTFREIIKPGAFANVLRANPDVIAAPNHNWDGILGRTTNGTLHLTDQEDGLHYAIDVNPEDQGAMDFYAKVKRADIHQSSFAYEVKTDNWDQPADKNILPLRTISEYSELIDVSPVTFPAYPTTSAGVRSKLNELAEGRGESEPQQVPVTPSGEAEQDALRAQARARLATYRRYLDLAGIS